MRKYCARLENGHGQTSYRDIDGEVDGSRQRAHGELVQYLELDMMNTRKTRQRPSVEGTSRRDTHPPGRSEIGREKTWWRVLVRRKYEAEGIREARGKSVVLMATGVGGLQDTRLRVVRLGMSP